MAVINVTASMARPAHQVVNRTGNVDCLEVLYQTNVLVSMLW